MVYLSVSFGVYSGECFDRVVGFFYTKNCVCKCPVRVNYP